MPEPTTMAATRRVRETRDLAAVRLPFTSIPVIDVRGAYSDRLADRQRVAVKIREASIGVGFFYVTNHGVPQTLIDRVFGASRDFFALPVEQKMKLHIGKHRHHAGYIPLRGERLDGRGDGDRKESLEISVGVPEKDLQTLGADPFTGDAILPDEHAVLREVLKEYCEAMWRLMRALNRIVGLALNLREDFFEAAFQMPITGIRLLRYAPAPATVGHGEIVRGCGEHSDYLWYTLLAQDDIGGLEVLNSAGRWVEAPPIPGTFVVNTGDLIAHWTNDLFASTVHRVSLNQNKHFRHSIAFFTGPNFEARIECLPSCTDPAHPPKYAPVKTGEYLYQRLNSTVRYGQ